MINYSWQWSVNIKVVLKKQSRREMAFWEGRKKKCRDLQWPCDILYSRYYSVAGITPGWVIISVSPNGYASWNIACLMNYPPSPDFSVSSAAGCRCCVERNQMFFSVVFLVDSISRAPSWIGHDEVSVVFLKNCSKTKAVSAKFHHQSEEIMEFTCWAATGELHYLLLGSNKWHMDLSAPGTYSFLPALTVPPFQPLLLLFFFLSPVESAEE